MESGRRDYTWSVDTIDNPMTQIRRTWASSKDNAWAVGPGSGDKLWYFNGIEWKPNPIRLLITPECIWGAGENDIWIGGNDGKIFHFDGNNWYQDFVYQKDNVYPPSINDIWGMNSKDIYATGRVIVNQGELWRSFILHYDGTKWTEIYFSTKQLQFHRILKENNLIYLSGIIASHSAADTLFFYKMEKNIIQEISRNTMDNITYISLSEIGGRTYFLIGKDLFSYKNNSFNKIMSFTIEKFGYQVSGRNETDIFIRMLDGLSHFNGNNIEYLYKFTNDYTGVWPNPVNLENAVFFAAPDNLNGFNFILRGVLE